MKLNISKIFMNNSTDFDCINQCILWKKRQQGNSVDVLIKKVVNGKTNEGYSGKTLNIVPSKINLSNYNSSVLILTATHYAQLEKKDNN